MFVAEEGVAGFCCGDGGAEGVYWRGGGGVENQLFRRDVDFLRLSVDSVRINPIFLSPHDLEPTS